MAKLSAADRSAIPASDFGLPASKSYPMPDKAHAANAKGRATQQAAKGNLSSAAETRIDRKADSILGKPSASRAQHFAKGGVAQADMRDAMIRHEGTDHHGRPIAHPSPDRMLRDIGRVDKIVDADLGEPEGKEPG